MKVTSVRDLGALVRSTRLAAGLTQADLAARLGVARDWVVRLEQGHPRLEAQKVLDALAALDVALDATHAPGPNSVSGSRARASASKKKGRTAARVASHPDSSLRTYLTKSSKESGTGSGTGQVHRSAQAGRYVTKKSGTKVSVTPKGKKSGASASSADPFDQLFQRR